VTYDSEVLADDPYAYYRLDGDGQDTSGNDRHGTAVGASWIADGPIDGALRFDGVDDHFDTGIRGFTNGTHTISVEFWIRSTETRGGRYALGVHGDDVRLTVEMNRDDVSERIRLGYRNLGQTPFTAAFDWDAPTHLDGQWHHVVAVMRGGDDAADLYIDSVYVGERTADEVNSRPHDFERDLYVGARNHSNLPDDPIDADLAAVAFYRSALTATRVEAHYDAAFEADESAVSNPLLSKASELDAMWAFGDDRDGSTWTNHGSVDQDATAVGASWSDSGGPGDSAVGYWLLDGTDDYVDAGDHEDYRFTQEHSLVAWIWYPGPSASNNSDDWSPIISKGDDTYQIRQNGSNTVRPRYDVRGGTGGNVDTYSAETTLTYDAWWCVVGRYDDENIELLWRRSDQESWGSVSASRSGTLASNTLALIFGAQNDTGTNIRRNSHIRLAFQAGFAYALSDAQRDELFDATFQTPVTYESEVLADEPIGYWKLDEPGSPSQFDDSSGGGYHLTQITGTTEHPPLVEGSDGARYFDGVDDRALRTTGFPYPTPSQGSTVECWVDSERQGLATFLGAGTGTDNDEMRWRINEDGTFRLSVGGTSVDGSLAAPWGAVHHYVGVFDRDVGEARFYVDGVLFETVPTSAQHRGGSGAVQVGARTVNNNNWLQGPASDVAVYHYALSPTRIEAHYLAGIGEVEPPEYIDEVLADNPVACWPLQGDGDDVAGNGNFTIVGATFDTDENLPFDQHLSTDGIDDYAEWLDSSNPLPVSLPGPFTHEAWVRIPTGWGSEEPGAQAWGLNDRVGLRRLSTSDAVTFLLRNSGGTNLADSGSGWGVDVPYTHGQWAHICVVYDRQNNRVKVYVNSVEVIDESATDDDAATNVQSFTLGAQRDNPTGTGSLRRFASIDVAWVAIYDTALSEQRIQAHYDAAFEVPPPELEPPDHTVIATAPTTAEVSWTGGGPEFDIEWERV